MFTLKCLALGAATAANQRAKEPAVLPRSGCAHWRASSRLVRGLPPTASAGVRMI